MEQFVAATTHRAPWNKGKLVGQKAPFKLKEIWAIRVRLQLYERIRWSVGTSRSHKERASRLRRSR